MADENDRINLQNNRKINIPRDDKKNKQDNTAYWRTSLKVPETDQDVMLKIDVKLSEIKSKKINNQDKWHIGIILFNKLLDYVDSSDINKNTNICKYIELMLEDKFRE